MTAVSSLPIETNFLVLLYDKMKCIFLPSQTLQTLNGELTA